MTNAETIAKTRADYDELAAWAVANGYEEQAREFMPEQFATLGEIDLSINQLLTAIGWYGYFHEWKAQS